MIYGNVSVVDGLEADFGERVDFIYLNIYTPDEWLWWCFRYTLIDADGTIIKHRVREEKEPRENL